MSTATGWVDDFLSKLDRTSDLDRVIATSTGLPAAEILAVLGDTRLGPNVIHALSDMMRPERSMYFDAIFGAFHGQVAVRNWLVPTMADIPFIEFVPMSPTDLFERDTGESSVDEWQMWAVLDGERLPMPRGVSVRHYEDGWITWNADVYDTGPFRPESNDSGQESPELPPPPETPWETRPAPVPQLSADATRWLSERATGAATADTPLSNLDLHSIVLHPVHGTDPAVIAELMHPTNSVQIDPVAGELSGQAAIGDFLQQSRAGTGTVRFDHVGSALFNGSCTTVEWVATNATDPTSRPPMRGTSIRRYSDGFITYAADYYDTALGR